MSAGPTRPANSKSTTGERRTMRSRRVSFNESPPRRLSGARDSAVDDETRRHHELRFVGRQEKSCLGDIFRQAQVVAQLSLADRGHPFFRVRVGLLQVALDKWREDGAGQQGVDPDAVL